MNMTFPVDATGADWRARVAGLTPGVRARLASRARRFSPMPMRST